MPHWARRCCIPEVRCRKPGWPGRAHLRSPSALAILNIDYGRFGGFGPYRQHGGAYRSALALAQRFSDLAATRPGSADLPVSDRMMGMSLHYLGDQRAARGYLERMLDRYVAPADRSHKVRFMFDLPAITRASPAQILWLQGWADQATCVPLNWQSMAACTADVRPRRAGLGGQGACPIALYTGDLATLERSVGNAARPRD